jgi:hypothetical protein
VSSRKVSRMATRARLPDANQRAAGLTSLLRPGPAGPSRAQPRGGKLAGRVPASKRTQHPVDGGLPRVRDPGQLVWEQHLLRGAGAVDQVHLSGSGGQRLQQGARRATPTPPASSSTRRRRRSVAVNAPYGPSASTRTPGRRRARTRVWSPEALTAGATPDRSRGSTARSSHYFFRGSRLIPFATE